MKDIILDSICSKRFFNLLILVRHELVLDLAIPSLTLSLRLARCFVNSTCLSELDQVGSTYWTYYLPRYGIGRYICMYAYACS